MILKEYMIRGYAANTRIRQIERQIEQHDHQLKEFARKIDYFVHTSIPPLEGVFYEGQILMPMFLWRI